ncbi:MAG TPA: choice-of-anchor D domain-containing protein [Kiritimatiellia bacterium]|nr:choice-of-anchor D domain-containing protein [Kiritimatiellia bacterium]HMO98903.1 choice-of-anchor D domain-containing protein [Kiritimatiellia bacterium]HMP96835.1 choice-of-anchor D domain-containing protein [Kiritimatiellia bacterium]
MKNHAVFNRKNQRQIGCYPAMVFASFLFSLLPAVGGIVISGGGLALVEEGGTFAPGNLATNGTAFALNEIGVAPHTIAGVNDGIYGNSSSWIGGTPSSFVGITFGAATARLHKVAFGRDNLGNFTDRALGLYTLQYTTVANPDQNTPDGSWTTIGTLDYQSAGGALFTNPAIRHAFTFDHVWATGFRIKMDSATDFIAIDEIELYRPPSGLSLSGGGLTLLAEGGTFDPNNLATGGVAFAKDELGTPPHTIGGVNDGVYGNSSSWIAGSSNSFIGISLGTSPVTVGRIAFGRDNTGNLEDRVFATYTLQYTTNAAPDNATPDSSWTTIGVMVYAFPDGPDFAYPARRHEFSFTPVSATGIRLAISGAAEADTMVAIDEIELYPPYGPPLLRIEQPAGRPHAMKTRVAVWGDTENGNVTAPTNLLDAQVVVAGLGRVSVLNSNRAYVGWGTIYPILNTDPFGLIGIKAVAHGWLHNLLLDSNGTIKAWAYADANGESIVPTSLTNETVKGIAAGFRFSVALTEAGQVVAWGTNSHGQVDVPPGLSHVTAIAAGFAHVLALKEDGTVEAWGDNSQGQSAVPPGLSGVTAIAAGNHHSLALLSNGAVVAWGWNADGQASVPSGLSNVTAIAGGWLHSLALRQDGTIVSWGANADGQGTIPERLTLARSISAAQKISAAIYSEHVALAFGPLTPPAQRSRTFTIYNDGTGPMAIAQVFTAGDHAELFSLDTTGMAASVPIGGTTSFTVTFAPTNTAEVETTLYILADDPDTPRFAFALTGNHPDNTPPVITTPSNIAVMTTSVGGEVLFFDVVVEDNADTEPFVSTIPPSGSLFPVGVHTVRVTAVDFAGNTSTASFVVNMKLPAPVRVETGGSFSTNNLAFGQQLFVKDFAFFPTHRPEYLHDGVYGNARSWIAGSTNSFLGFVLGSTPVPVQQIAFGRDNNGLATDRYAGTYTIQFTTSATPNSSSTWIDLGTIVHPGESPVPWRRNRYAIFPVAATAIRILVASSGELLCIDEVELYAYDPAPVIGVEYPPDSPLTSQVSTIDFGVQETGLIGATNVVTIRNTGNAYGQILGITTSGAHSNNFVVGTSGMVSDLPHGASTTFSVTFHPTGLGARSAILRIATTDRNEPEFEINLAGISTDTAPPVIASVPDITTYASDPAGIVVFFPAPVVTDNSGEPPVVDVAPPNGSLFPLGTNIVTITATDAANNVATGSFRIIVLPRPDAVIEAPVGTVLSGEPPAYAFGTVQLGSVTTQTFIVRNEGLIPLSISGISVLGAHPGNFILDASGLATNIAAGDDSSFSVTFAPTVHGSRLATVRLLTSDPWLPVFDLSLSGDGLDILPPVITPLADITVHAGSGTGGVRVLYPPIHVTDDSEAVLTVEFAPENGSLMTPGTHPVTITAFDGNNTSTSSFNIVVLQVAYPPDVPVGSAVPFNLAIGKNAFALNSAFFPAHDVTYINDELYGNNRSWIGATLSSFIGVNLGATTVKVNRIAFSRDHNGMFVDRTDGTYTLQFTTTPNPNAATPDSAWQTLGSITYPGNVSTPSRRNMYAFPDVWATGVRLKILSSGSPVAIDQIEIYGDVGHVTLTQLPDIPLTSGVSTITFAPQDLATPSVPRTVTLGNLGPEPIRITGIAVTNNQAGDFILTPPNLVTTLAVGASTTLQAVFQPPALGPRETTLRVRVENATLAAFDVALAGTGVDVSAPVIVTPGDITVFIPLNETNAVVTYPPAQVSDNSGFPADVTYSHPSGSVFPLGITPVTITAVDPSSNTSTATFAIGVQYEPTLSLEVIEGNPFVQKNIVQAWGATFIGLPMPSNLPSATAVSLGYQHGLILLEDGTVVAWGDDSAGQRTVPAGLSNVIAIAAGAWHSLAITADGTVTAWGKHEPDILKPPVVVPPGLTGVVQVSGGYYMSAARLANGSIVVWGGNQQGQLTVPPGLTNVIDISCSTDHCLAALTDGTVVAWGDNEFGKLNVPAGLSNVIQVTAGRNASVALRADGTAVGWGRNAANEYGGLSGATNLMEVQTGLEHTVARRADGTLLVSGTPGSPQVTGAAGLEDALSIGSAQSLTAAAVVKNWPVITFDTISLGTRVTNTFILRNTGPGPLNVTNFILVGTNTNQFQVDTSATIMPLASGATTTVSVIYNPTGPLGVRTATLRLYSNDQQIPLWKVRLTAEATDDEPPVFPLLEDLIAYASDTGGVRVLLQPLAVDNSGQPPAITTTPPTTSKFLPGSNLVTVVATDGAGNAATGTFRVIVRITSAPPVVGPSDPVPPNLALGKTPFAQNVLPFFPHTIPALNDGIYGNNSSWIGSTTNSFAGINLGATPVLIDRIAFGRDNTGIQISRAEGTYILQVTTTPNPTAATPDNAWQTIGVVVNPGLLDVLYRRNLFAFKPVLATGVRILVATTGPEIGIDEIELYGPPELDPFAVWQAANFSAGELLDAAISGPFADPGNTGIANLFRYATGLGRHDDPKPAMPRLQALQFIYRRLLDPDAGVAYAVELTTNLLHAASWRGIEIADGITETSATPNPDGITEDVRMSIPPGTINPALNLRLKVTPEE